MLVLETKAVEFEGRRAAILEARNHGLATTGITAHRIDGDRIVPRHQTGIDQRPQQRDRTGWIAARIGDFPFRPYLVGLIGLQFRKTVGPVGRDAKGGRCVQHLGRRGSHAVDQGDGLLRGVIRQAQDHKIHFLHQRALGAGILALVVRNALHHHVVLPGETLGNAEPRRSSRAVDEYRGPRGNALGRHVTLRLPGIGKIYGAFLQAVGAPAGAGDL